CFWTPHPSTATLFPDTTLFRSLREGGGWAGVGGLAHVVGFTRPGSARCPGLGRTSCAAEREPPPKPPDPSNRAASAASLRDTSRDRKSTRLNSSHEWISYAVFC